MLKIQKTNSCQPRLLIQKWTFENKSWRASDLFRAIDPPFWERWNNISTIHRRNVYFSMQRNRLRKAILGFRVSYSTKFEIITLCAPSTKEWQKETFRSKSIIECARSITNVQGLSYDNNDGVEHFWEKKHMKKFLQNFKTEKVGFSCKTCFSNNRKYQKKKGMKGTNETAYLAP